MMEKNNSNSTNNNINSTSSNHNRERPGGGGGDHQNGLLRTATHPPETRSTSAVVAATTSSDSFLQWGNRKRLRCMKSQVNKDHHHNNNGSDPVHHRTTGRVDRRVIRSDTNNNTKDGSASLHQPNGNNGYLNLRQRPSSPSHRILRNSENSIGMKGGQSSNGVMRGITSPDRVGAQDKRGSSSSAHHNTTTTTAINNNNNSNINNHNNHHHHISHTTTNNNNDNNGGGGGGSGGSSEAQDSKKGGGGGSGSSGSDAIPAVWPPKFVIALTNKEKEEDFIAFKGSKLPQRPKKRAKFIQRTVNLVCPGAWLCDLTLERYEVREKKITKKRPRGLKAMGNMESDSE